MRGAIWTVVGFGGSQFLRLGFNLVVTRLLYPELFGLVALVNTFMTGLALFCDVGIEAAVVRDPRGAEPAFLHTAWSLQILRGIALAAASCLMAWPIAWFYGDRRLAGIVLAIGLANLPAGLNSTSLALLKRNLDVRRLVALEIGSQLLSGAVMIAWAWLRPSVWALVSAPLTWALTRLVWSHRLSVPGNDRLGWDRAALRELVRFGRWIWISSTLAFLALQVDRLILGKLLDWRTLGIYGLVAGIAELPRSLIMAVGTKVIYPAYAKAAGMPRAQLRARILRHRWPLLLFLAAAIATLTIAGDAIVRRLFDPRYAAGAWMLPVLALGIWPSALANTIDSSLVAIGQPHRQAAANLAKILFTVIGIPVGFHLMGVTGAVLVVALNDLPYYGQITYGLQREGLSCWAQDAKATALLAIAIALALLARGGLGLGNPLGGAS